MGRPMTRKKTRNSETGQAMDPESMAAEAMSSGYRVRAFHRGALDQPEIAAFLKACLEYCIKNNQRVPVAAEFARLVAERFGVQIGSSGMSKWLGDRLPDLYRKARK